MTWRIPFRVACSIHRAFSPVAGGYAYAREHARKPAKQTPPSRLLANWAWNRQLLRDAYDEPFELLADATAVMREHASELAGLGRSGSAAGASPASAAPWSCDVLGDKRRIPPRRFRLPTPWWRPRRTGSLGV
jgi:hypothetical protein